MIPRPFSIGRSVQPLEFLSASNPIGGNRWKFQIQPIAAAFWNATNPTGGNRWKFQIQPIAAAFWNATNPTGGNRWLDFGHFCGSAARSAVSLRLTPPVVTGGSFKSSLLPQHSGMLRIPPVVTGGSFRSSLLPQHSGMLRIPPVVTGGSFRSSLRPCIPRCYESHRNHQVRGARNAAKAYTSVCRSYGVF